MRVVLRFVHRNFIVFADNSAACCVIPKHLLPNPLFVCGADSQGSLVNFLGQFVERRAKVALKALQFACSKWVDLSVRARRRFWWQLPRST